MVKPSPEECAEWRARPSVQSKQYTWSDCKFAARLIRVPAVLVWLSGRTGIHWPSKMIMAFRDYQERGEDAYRNRIASAMSLNDAVSQQIEGLFQGTGEAWWFAVLMFFLLLPLAFGLAATYLATYVLRFLLWGVQTVSARWPLTFTLLVGITFTWWMWRRAYGHHG